MPNSLRISRHCKIIWYRKHILNQDVPYQYTGELTGEEETFPHEDYDMQGSTRSKTHNNNNNIKPKKQNHQN